MAAPAAKQGEDVAAAAAVGQGGSRCARGRSGRSAARRAGCWRSGSRCQSRPEIQRSQASSNLYSVGQLRVARQVYLAEKGLLGFWANAGLLTVQIVLEKVVFFFAFVVLR